MIGGTVDVKEQRVSLMEGHEWQGLALAVVLNEASLNCKPALAAFCDEGFGEHGKHQICYISWQNSSAPS